MLLRLPRSVFLEHALNKTQLNKLYEIELIKIKILYKVMEIKMEKNKTAQGLGLMIQ